MIVFATDFSLWKFCCFRLWMVHYPTTSSYKNLRCKWDDHSNWGYVDEIYISTDKLRSFDKPLKMVAQVFRCFFGSKTHLVGGSQSYRIPPLLITVNQHSTWKLMVGRRSFPFAARPIFRGELLVSGSVCQKRNLTSSGHEGNRQKLSVSFGLLK